MLREDINRLNADISALESLKRHIQNNECKHENLEGEFKANTGNWDRGDDSYWVNLSCPECGKYWTEDQEHVSYCGDGPDMHFSKDGFRFKSIRKY